MTRSDSDPLQAEIDAALSETNLQDLDPDDPTKPQAGARARKDSRGRLLQSGTIVGTSGSDVIVELGPRVQGVIDIGEFEAAPQVGQTFDFTLNGRSDDGLWNLSRKEARTLAAWNDLTLGAEVQATVAGVNKGGLELKVGPLRAFMPASHLDLVRVEDLSTAVGQSFVCEVIELDQGKNKIVLSRRNVLGREREIARQETVGKLEPGSRMTGKVTRVESFGAFVDIGGIEGLVHVSNLSRKRVEDPNEFVKKGDQVQVMVLEIKEGGKRVGLGMKQLEPDPWDEVADKLAPDAVVSGKVIRLMDFGAFVEVMPGIEGLLHVSQMLDNQRVNRPGDVVQIGQELPVRVIAVDRGAQRISLSRLDPRGAVLGSEDAADASIIDEVLDKSQTGGGAQTNLGALFKRALDGGS